VNQDQEHLQLLSALHYVMAGLACLLPLAATVYIGLGTLMLTGKFASGSRAATSGDRLTGYIFVGVGALFFVVGVVGAALNFMGGRALGRRERRSLCLVVAGLNCLHMPLGTALGVFTFIVLSRPSVQALFSSSSSDSSLEGPLPGYPPGASPFSGPDPRI